jgi:hypothetical protein
VRRTRPGEVIKPGHIKSIDEEGMPMHKNPFVKGKLYIKFDIVFPADGTISPQVSLRFQPYEQNVLCGVSEFSKAVMRAGYDDFGEMSAETGACTSADGFRRGAALDDGDMRWLRIGAKCSKGVTEWAAG